MIGHDEVRVLAYPEVVRPEDPLGLQDLYLLYQHLRVDHDPAAYYAGLSRVEYARRQEVEDELLFTHDDGVPGVVAPLEADDYVCAIGKDIDYLPLAFVPPLGAYNDYVIGHLITYPFLKI